MKKFFSTVLIIVLVVVALGGIALIIRNNATPPDDGITDIPNIPDIPGSEIPVVKKDTLTVAGKDYIDGAEIFCVSGNNVFLFERVEEYSVSVNWDKDNNASSSSFDYVLDGKYYGFSVKEYMKAVKVEKDVKQFSVYIPSIDDYLFFIHNVQTVDNIDYSAYSEIKFNLVFSYGDKKLNYVLNVDLTKCIPSAIILGSESVCF